MAKPNSDDEKAERKSKSSGKSVNARIPEEQYDMIQKLDGVLGVGESGVVASIINSWFEQQDWYREKIKEKANKKV